MGSEVEVTAADREKATSFVCGALDDIGAFDHSNDEARDRRDVEHAIAALIADERAKARAPFLALAERFSWDTMREPDWTGSQVADAIRRAAENPPEVSET